MGSGSGGDEKNNVTSVSGSILTSPEYFFAAQGKTLEERLQNVVLSEEQTDEIESSKGRKVVRDAVLSSLVIGKIAKTFIDWNEGVDKEIKEADVRTVLNAVSTVCFSELATMATFWVHRVRKRQTMMRAVAIVFP